MTPERWKKIAQLYQSALERDTRERGAFLEQACGEDTTLRREVESLLDADQHAEGFISGWAGEEVPGLIEKNAVSLTSGQELGHYRIIRKIGVGGMGEVYLANDTKLNRDVAIKTLPLYYALNHDYLRRFQTEVKASASLNHPNVATIYSVEEIEGLPFFTMEYVEGSPLNNVLKEGPLKLDSFLEIFMKLADAFAHAHRKGVVHRDIKPGNILIQKDGTPKVLDFGLAYLDRTSHERSVAASSLTNPGQVLGTPAYMSPEQAKGRDIDQRSDIFSFGVVMYEAVTGSKPFSGDNYASVISKVLGEEPVSVSELKPSTPYLLVRLIHRCLDKARQKRFQSMDEVRVILEEIKAAHDAGISLAHESAERILTGRRRMNWQALLVAGGFIAAIAVIALSFIYLRNGSEDRYRIDNFTFRRLSQTNDVVYAGISPDGGSIAYNRIEPNGDRSMWIRLVDDRTALKLAEPQDVHYWGGLTFSNDSNHVYYITAKKDARAGTLYRVSALGGNARKIADSVNDLGSTSPDGTRILFVRYLESMKLISANADDGSDEREILSGGPGEIFRDPQFSADGRSIYMIRFRGAGGEEFWSLVELPVEGGAERVIIPERKPRINELVVLRNGTGLLLNAVDPETNLPQLYYLDPEDGSLTRITNDLNSYFGISASDDGKTIVAAQRSDAKDIWVGTGDRLAEYRRITSEPTFYRDLAWTTDGRIIYDSVDNNRPHIWIMNPDGSGREQLTPDGTNDFGPLVTPDGKQVYFVSERTGERRIWRMNVDGTSPVQPMDVEGVTESPVLSPDGSMLYFKWTRAEKEVLGRLNLASGRIDELPFFGDGRWAISPDGGSVAFIFYDETGGRYKVGIRDLDSPEVLQSFEISPIDILLWAPDGKGILYRNIEAEDNRQEFMIWRQDIEDTDPVSFITSESDMLYKLAIAPDGKQRAVVSRRLLTDAVMLTRRD